MDKNLIQRLIFGFLYALVIIMCTSSLLSTFLFFYFKINVLPEYLYFGLITFFLIVSLFEITNVMKFKGGYMKWILYPLSLIVYYRFGVKFFNNGFYLPTGVSEYLGLLLIPIAIYTLFKYPSELFNESGKLIFSLIYVVIPFSFSLYLPVFIKGIPETFSANVLWIFVLIWSSDSFAYVFGRIFGKHKMAPKISPKKTWEGFVGGFFCTLILGGLMQYFISIQRGNFIVLAGLIAIFAPLGDLVESQLKRAFGVKDSGNLIPGHGGILDRLDSFIICAPVVYLYYNIFF